MEKTRPSINGENSSTKKNSTAKNSSSNTGSANYTAKISPNNKSYDKFLCRKKLALQNVVASIWEEFKVIMQTTADWIHANFILIMSAIFIFNMCDIAWNNPGTLALVISATLSVVSMSLRKFYDRRDHDSKLDKIRKFKRFTHKRADGSIDIKNAELEQIILYLYEVEEFLCKPDGDQSSPA